LPRPHRRPAPARAVHEARAERHAQAGLVDHPRPVPHL
jgi:hypothetical protein